MFQAFLSLLVLVASALGAEEYDVRMNRPSKAGERLLVTGSYQANESRIVKADGKVVKSDQSSLAVEFEAEREAIEVTEFGKVSRARAKILKIEGTFGGKPVTELKTGDMIESSAEGMRDKITVNGQPATAQQDQIGRGILSTSRGGATNDDDTFGPGRKVKVGEEWPINPEAAAKAGAEEGIKGLKPEDLKGNVKFIEVTQIDGKPHLRLRCAMEMKGAGIPVPDAPPGIKVDEMVASVQMESDFPVDPTAVIPTIYKNGDAHERRWRIGAQRSQDQTRNVRQLHETPQSAGDIATVAKARSTTAKCPKNFVPVAETRARDDSAQREIARRSPAAIHRRISDHTCIQATRRRRRARAPSPPKSSSAAEAGSGTRMTTSLPSPPW